MPKVLNLDEMLDVISMIDPTGNSRDYSMFRNRLEGIGTDMAEFIANRLNADFDPAVSEGIAFAGTCANFYPKSEAQPIPVEMEVFDTDGEWEVRGA